ncbi:MAG: DNA polymerase III subunit gamma/tau [Firmicutes bacterium]|nr:DNA polymerase III subunit gamma/tau [Bacillota bacterium]
MSYQALYRKYRPGTFSGVIGQEHITRTLKTQVKTGRVSHAYLFCGTRGTGKTSTAKILAKAINCTSPVDGEPCGRCASCEAAAAERSPNIIEIDAASNNGVENIRTLREEVRYTPASGSYKVYIIDEVHMLSQGAFNALLKTLEEPPDYVIFILATTEPQKVPITILSRCQRYDFRRITSADIAEAVQSDLCAEGTEATLEAVNYIARLADGSMRDALSLADQCAAFWYGEVLTLEKVLAVTGGVDSRMLIRLTDALLDRDAGSALKIADEICAQGKDIPRLITELIAHLRNLLLCAVLKEPGELLGMSDEEAEKLKAQADRCSQGELIRLIERLSLRSSEAKRLANPRVLLEVELIRLCFAEEEEEEPKAKKRASRPQNTPEKKSGSEKAAVKTEEKTSAKAPAPESGEMLKAFEAVKKNFSKGLNAMLEKACAKEKDGALILLCEYSVECGLINGKKDIIAEKLAEKLGRKVKVAAELAPAESASNESEAMEFERTLSSMLPDASFDD